MLSRVLAIAFFSFLLLAPGGAQSQEVGVYIKVADVADATVAGVAAEAEKALNEAGWTVLAAYDAGVDGDACVFRARVLVVDWPEYTQSVMSRGTHGAFAAPLRVSVYEDEMGVHIAAVNPRSINRTIVTEQGMEQDWTRFAAILRRTLAQGVGAAPVYGDFGQFREKGRIDRTMGVMAGGPFLEKIKSVASVPAGEGGAEAVAKTVFEALEAAGPGKGWGIRPVFLMTPAPGVAVLGVTGERMEARSFSIVGKGSDDSRSGLACPGLDHSAAYPIEVVFTQEGEEVDIQLVDAMFRMKMFFEDAGKMKFARNMGMPGSIESEIKELIRTALF
jgi:uncharacterized protein (DUF302 family)